MSGDMMPKEQYDFIEGIQDYMVEASNMTESQAWDFGFRIWQFRKWLCEYMTIEVSEDNEPTWEQVKDYCFKRNYAVVGREIPKEYLRGYAEVSEDTISREYVKGICEDMLDEEMLEHMLGYIENAPSVIPQVPNRSEDERSRR